MKTSTTLAVPASTSRADQLNERLRNATVRRASDEKRFAKALKRQHSGYLTAEEAIQLARNLNSMLDGRQAQIGRRLGKLCEGAFGATSSRELYRIRLAEGEDPDKKQLRRSFGPYRLIAEEIASMTGEPQTKVLRELVARTRFDELQAKMAEWDRVDAVVAHLQDLIDRLNDEFRWDELYQRTADLRISSGGKLTWPLNPNDHHAPAPNQSSDPVPAWRIECFERKLRASSDPAQLFYAFQHELPLPDGGPHFYGNDQLQSNEFFFVPHARIGFIDVCNLPSRSEHPVEYQIERQKLVLNARAHPDWLEDPKMGWDTEAQEPKGQLDTPVETATEYTWLVAYPSPLGNRIVVPALYTSHQEGGPWLMPLDRNSLASVEDAVWFDQDGDCDLIERLETLLGADQDDGICQLERDLRQTGTWLAQNPVLKWERRQQARRQNMLNRARSSPVRK